MFINYNGVKNGVISITKALIKESDYERRFNV